MTVWECRQCKVRLPAEHQEVTMVGRAPYHSKCQDVRRNGLMTYVGEYSTAAIEAMSGRTMPPPAPPSPRRSRYERLGPIRAASVRTPSDGFNRPFARLFEAKGIGR